MRTNEYTADRRFTRQTTCDRCERKVGPYLHSTPQVDGKPGPRVCRECYDELGYSGAIPSATT